MSIIIACERCNDGTLATHYQQYREPSYRKEWPNTPTYRCASCAQQLRDYVAIMQGWTILVDKPLEDPPKLNRSKEMLEEAIKMAKEDRNGAMLEVLVPLRAELAKLHQALRDIVDFDIGEMPEPDGMCAAEGPKKVDRHNNAWDRALEAVGPRNNKRYEGDVP